MEPGGLSAAGAAHLATRRKQRLSHGDFLKLWKLAPELVPAAELEALVERALLEVRGTCGGARSAFAWSGGKDSLVVQDLCEQVGVRAGVLVITELEFPVFLRWATDRMPHGLTVHKRPLDLPWLAANLRMLFPRDAATASRWFRLVQHAGQRAYAREEGLELLVTGRRRVDGNYVPAGAGGCYLSAGVRRFSPIRDWSHAHVFAYLQARGLELPPTYSWPRGFRVGTGPWPARQWCASVAEGWREVWSIDPGVVTCAAALIPSAAEFLECAASSPTAAMAYALGS